MTSEPLLPDCFHPVVRTWFAERLGHPSDIQEQAWPRIAAGEHVFAIAPTGSGKTLTAFLWGLNQLLTGAWTGGCTRLVYISPLKALNNDIRKNVLVPLRELSQRFAEAGLPPPTVSVMVRSGDTPPAERRLMSRRPPEILVCTPEALGILLTSASGDRLFSGIKALILDEIHAIAASKRGCALMLNVERLAFRHGEFQRIALSATVEPAAAIARFVAGYQLLGDPDQADTVTHLARPIRILRSNASKRLEVSISHTQPPLWDNLAAELYRQILEHRSSLIFVQSRRMAERLTRMINDLAPEGEPPVYSHHGSLSREIRLEVEERLKTGRLKAIVATASLELGIDIGNLDLVLQVGVPDGCAQALQRLGRSGHRVGATSRGIIYPLHEKDALEAGVLRELVLERSIEEIKVIQNPLDVLAQLIVSISCRESWLAEGLYNRLRCADCCHSLDRRHFDLLVAMLCGSWAETRLRELSPRLVFDPLTSRYSAMPGQERNLYLNGGTIPDRGYFALRTANGEAKLGELDEEFVWERKIGDSFALGGRAWKIEAIDHTKVLVSPAGNSVGLTPFWKADRRWRSFLFYDRFGSYLESLARTEPADLPAILRRQAEVTGVPWPHRHHLVMELCPEEDSGNPANGLPPRPAKAAVAASPRIGSGVYHYLLHCLWGQRVNQPLAFALAAAWERTYHSRAEIQATNDCIFLALDRPVDCDGLFGLLQAWPLEELLRSSLEASALFGACFRENAGRALLLSRRGFGKRQPFWMTRLRSRRLWEAVKPKADFPILLETWRGLLNDEFDLGALRMLLAEVADGTIAGSSVAPASISPFGAGMVWQRTNRYMYEDDSPERTEGANYSGDPVADTLRNQELRPLIPRELCVELQQRLQACLPGLAPGSAAELLQLIRDRVLVSRQEFAGLMQAINQSAGQSAAQARGQTVAPPDTLALWWPELEGRLCLLGTANLRDQWVCALDQAWRLLPNQNETGTDGGTPALTARLAVLENGLLLAGAVPPATRRHTPAPEQLFFQWISYYGPLRLAELEQHPVWLALLPPGAIPGLVADGSLIVGPLTEQSQEAEICEAENLERLLRLRRSHQRLQHETWQPGDVVWLRARLNQLDQPGDLIQALALLEGWTARAEAWEEHLLPARVEGYTQHALDELFASSAIRWRGYGPRRLMLFFSENAQLVQAGSASPDGSASSDGSASPPDQPQIKAEPQALFPDAGARYAFFDLQDKLGANSAELANHLWELAWEGTISADSFSAVRQGLGNNFRASPASLPTAATKGRSVQSRLRHQSFREWQKNRPVQSWWYRWPETAAETGQLGDLELSRERARILLDRYGLVSPAVLERETGVFGWASLKKTFMLMELSGELVSGLFVEGLAGPQYLSKTALRLLHDTKPHTSVFWFNATDPVSPLGQCEWSVRQDWNTLPRLDSTWLVFANTHPLLVARRDGLQLDFAVPPDHPELPRAFGLFSALASRQWNPVHPVKVETINEVPARQSPWLPALLEAGFRQNNRFLEWWRG